MEARFRGMLQCAFRHAEPQKTVRARVRAPENRPRVDATNSDALEETIRQTNNVERTVCRVCPYKIDESCYANSVDFMLLGLCMFCSVKYTGLQLIWLT
jgi:hypothetical protein